MTDTITADDVKTGFYWMRRGKGAPREPVAIWRDKDTNELVCAAGFDKKRTNPTDVWLWCAENKIDNVTAKFAWEHRHFPDEPAPIGHNSPPSDDPYEALKTEIEAKQKQAQDWMAARPTIRTQKDADYSTNAQRELLALNKRADAMFTAEKAPHLAACRNVDERYRFRAAVADVADRLRKVFGRFMVAEEQRQKAEAEAKHKAELERVAAECKRLEEERAAKLRDDPVAALTEAPPELPLVPAAPEAVKVTSGGGIGKRAALQDVWVGTITDYREAAMFFIEHPKMVELVDKLVAHQVKDLKATARIPGVTVSKERRAA